MARHPRLLATLAALVLVAAAGCTAARASAVHGTSASPAGSPSASPSSTSASPTPPAPTPATPANPTPTTPTSKPPTSKPPKPPTGTATGRGPFGSLASTGSGAVALTFDDGPGPYTDDILNLLKQYNVKATFCVIGRQVHSYPSQIRRIVAEGHTLCNHTWDHDLELRTRTPDQIRAELQMTNDAIHAIVPGAKIQYFRNPGGNFSAGTVSIAQSLGMKSLFWSVDPRDWAKPGTQVIIDNVLSRTRPGSIVLSHDGGGDRSQTVAAYRVLLPNLKSRLTLIAMPVS
jgi:peptidoglycan/xylan/chitin deacetylase (PgdA/CDA1 family)